MNRLSQETSPYLLQHADNPVHWYPWGEEAFANARGRNVPILLSVGYSACHWCHVMAHECFENQEIAAQMNREFVCVKVDREERPDIDSLYMEAVQLTTGQGGWPMTVFLTPQALPFYCGTYFPPEDRYGRPGLPRIMTTITEAWTNSREDIEERGAAVLDGLRHSENLPAGSGHPIAEVFASASQTIASRMDSYHGGLNGAPKFPMPSVLEVLLRATASTGDKNALSLLERTLQRMALGGIYDQLAGGFHRYSTDEIWLAPHFEKMLYDNAQLALLYVRAWQETQNPFYQGVAEETFAYLQREMMDDRGAFYSAQDADSDGAEGTFYIWSEAEIRAALPPDEAEVFASFYDITTAGNWEGHCILRVVKPLEEVANHFQLTLEQTADLLENARQRLYELRTHRTAPGLDDKVITSWNGLAITAFAEAGRVFQQQDLLDTACRAADFILANMTRRDDATRLRLWRTWRADAAKHEAVLEDYGALSCALITLYETTGEAKWLSAAIELGTTLIQCFAVEGGGFYTSAFDAESLLIRTVEWQDNAVPGGCSMAVEALMRLSDLTGNLGFKEFANTTLHRASEMVMKYPTAFGRMLNVMQMSCSSTVEIMIVPGNDPAETTELLNAAWAHFVPARCVAVINADSNVLLDDALVTGKGAIEGHAAAYVCRNRMCSAPVSTAAQLVALLV